MDNKHHNNPDNPDSSTCVLNPCVYDLLKVVGVLNTVMRRQAGQADFGSVDNVVADDDDALIFDKIEDEDLRHSLTEVWIFTNLANNPDNPDCHGIFAYIRELPRVIK